MSKVLKRPMFRKGGEVMEGIMTGIKPRESFQDKGMSDTMRDDIKSIQNRINLVDGMKIDFDNGWVHLRRSNTEPIIRIYSESSSKEKADNIANDFIKQIKEII